MKPFLGFMLSMNMFTVGAIGFIPTNEIKANDEKIVALTKEHKETKTLKSKIEEELDSLSVSVKEKNEELTSMNKSITDLDKKKKELNDSIRKEKDRINKEREEAEAKRKAEQAEKEAEAQALRVQEAETQAQEVASSEPQAQTSSTVGASDDNWHRSNRRDVESTNNYTWDSPSGYKGAYQFTQQTWNATAAAHGLDPNDHSPNNQDAMADAYAVDRWGGWGNVPTSGGW